MRKQTALLALTVGMSAMMGMTAFAGVWIQDTNRPANQDGISNWWYQNDDASYPKDGWQWVDGNGDGTAECYYFNADGWMYASTNTPDQYQVNENGAWIDGGVIQTKQVETNSGSTGGNANQNEQTQMMPGWHTDAIGKRYYTSNNTYVTGWKKIDKKKYYFDETGYMVTGYQELEDGEYYFYSDGRLAENYVHDGGVYYVIDEDGRIIDEVAEEDWSEYRRESGITTSADDIKDKTYDRSSGINEEMALDFLDLVNAERAKRDLDPLEINDSVMEAAQIRAEELVEKFSHTRPDGSTCYTALEEVGADYSSAGENIAKGQTTPASVVNSWMNSSGHKANILKKTYTETGVACYIYNGTCYWVQMFYTP